MAVQYEDFQLFYILVELGTNINITDTENNSLIMLTVEKRLYDWCKILVNKNVNFD